MLEIELKLQLPQAKQEKMIHAINNPEPIHLGAQYFDSVDRNLVQNAIALRLRQEGALWVQTFKAKGKNSLERIEIDIALGKRKTAPKLNLGLYKDNPTVQTLLADALGNNTALLLQFETHVERYIQVFDYQGTTIEMCVDIGEIRSQGRSQALSEVEFELKQGHVEQLLQFAQSWIQPYGLWLDVRSKAERGTLLSLQQIVSKPVTSKVISLTPKMPVENALKQLISAQLEHLLPNLAVVADGIDSMEHRHQTRVALRQLHSLLKSFAPLSKTIPKHWLLQVKMMLQVLGAARDADVFEQDILLQLKCVVPNLNPQITDAASQAANLKLLAEQMTCPETQQLLFQLMTYAYVEQICDKPVKLHKVLLPSLEKLYKRICQQGKNFNTLPSTEQHNLRKQIKRLRYSLNALNSILNHSSWAKLLEHLQHAQQHIGHYHDLEMALEFAQKLKPQSAREQALDYLHTQQVDAQKSASKALKYLLKCKSPF